MELHIAQYFSNGCEGTAAEWIEADVIKCDYQ